MVKDLTPYLTSSDITLAGKGRYILLLQGENRSPVSPCGLYWHLGCIMGMKSPALYWIFSNTTQAGRLEHLTAAWGGWSQTPTWLLGRAPVPVVFGWTRVVIYLQVFCLIRLPLSWPFVSKHPALLSFVCLFVSICIFRVSASPTPCIEFIKQKENLESSVLLCSVGTEIHSWLAFFLHLSESS